MKNLTKSQKIGLIISLILTALTLAFIWGSSMLPKTQSANQSRGVFEALKGVLDGIFGVGVITEEILRKLAHGGEFALLGVEICLVWLFLARFSARTLHEICFLGLFVAVADEGIQILSKRGPLVTDILIDFGGVIVATLIFFGVWILIKSIKNKRKKEREDELFEDET